MYYIVLTPLFYCYPCVLLLFLAYIVKLIFSYFNYCVIKKGPKRIKIFNVI